MPRSEMLVLEPPGDAKASVVVFTDVDCEFCRMFHGRIGEYLALGIEVRYVAYPRAGVGSATFKSMVSAWCADDRLGAITALKSGGTVAPLDCRNPVGSHSASAWSLAWKGRRQSCYLAVARYQATLRPVSWRVPWALTSPGVAHVRMLGALVEMCDQRPPAMGSSRSKEIGLAIDRDARARQGPPCSVPSVRGKHSVG